MTEALLQVEQITISGILVNLHHGNDSLARLDSETILFQVYLCVYRKDSWHENIIYNNSILKPLVNAVTILKVFSFHK
jgi:hypothetical protein